MRSLTGVLVGLALVVSACGTEVATSGDPRPTPGPTSEMSGGPVRPTPSPAPTPTPPPVVCPASGAQVSVSPVEAALGHRAVVLTVTNCRARTLTVEGYPVVSVLDGKRKPLGVTVAHDSSYMAMDPGPRRLQLRKGERALSVVAWSNTVTDGDPATGQYLGVAARASDPRVVWPVMTDLGTTGKVELTAWSQKLAN